MFSIRYSLFIIYALSGIIGTSHSQTRSLTGIPNDLIGLPPIGSTQISNEFTDGSYALLIGMSNYENRQWATLSSIPDEISQLSPVLRAQGYHVVSYVDTNKQQTEYIVDQFVQIFGARPQSRLFIFFAGHGTTIDNRGYFVPVDAPDKISNLGAFRAKAISMDRVLAWVSDIRSRHAIIIFDSCFSGTVLASRSSASIPTMSKENEKDYLERIALRPVRHYITSGDKDQEVPSKSQLVPHLINTMKGYYNPGRSYVSAIEAGINIQTRIAQTGLRPLSNRSYSPDFNTGDFVFDVVSVPDTLRDGYKKAPRPTVFNSTPGRVPPRPANPTTFVADTMLVNQLRSFAGTTRIEFAANSSDLSQSAMETLKLQAEFLKAAISAAEIQEWGIALKTYVKPSKVGGLGMERSGKITAYFGALGIPFKYFTPHFDDADEPENRAETRRVDISIFIGR